MKKINSIFFPVALLLMTLALFGCGDDDNQVPESKIKITMELSPKKLADLQRLKAKLTVEDKDWHIVGVEWYLNNDHNPGASGNIEPSFRLTNGWPEGIYPIKAIVTCINGDSKETVEVTETFEIIRGNFSVTVKMKGPDPYTEGNVIKVGDEFECEIVFNADETTFDVNLTRVVFSLDGKEVADVKKSPFIYKKKFEKTEVGTHTLTYHTYYEGEVNTDVSDDITLQVVE